MNITFLKNQCFHCEHADYSHDGLYKNISSDQALQSGHFYIECSIGKICKVPMFYIDYFFSKKPTTLKTPCSFYHEKENKFMFYFKETFPEAFNRYIRESF